MRSRALIIACAFLALPCIASALEAPKEDVLRAQVAALQAQIASLQQKNIALPGIRLCIAPERKLMRADSGIDVANLQIFLGTDPKVYPEKTVLGAFGPATERALQRWQKKYAIVSAGTPATTGYGALGDRTLDLMRQLWSCGGAVSVGWFSAAPAGTIVTFSAQASSTAPLDTTLFLDTGDGAERPLVVSSAVCRSLSGQCSSLMTVQHQYAPGTYTATLKRTQTKQQCIIFPQTCGDGVNICASLPPMCTPQKTTETLATTTVTIGGVAAATANTVQSAEPPSIRVVSPARGTVVAPAGSMTIAWSAAYAPQGASVALSLKGSDGTMLGRIVANQRSTGSYWWTLPLPSGSGCVGDTLTCLSKIAGSTCSGGVCAVDEGTYSIVAQIVVGGVAVASAESASFLVSRTTPPATVVAASTDTSTHATSTSARAVSTDASTSTAATEPSGGMCMYSSIPYGNGVTLQVGCTDLAGLSCGDFGSLTLTCKNGTWVDPQGAAALVPRITTQNGTGASCRTPWGGQTVLGGNQIPYEPFFTNGVYSGNAVIPLMQCTAGSWQKCNWDGTGCKAYSTL